MQNKASQEADAKKSAEAEKQNAVKAQSNCNTAQKNLAVQKQQAETQISQQKQATQQAHSNCQAAQRQLSSCQAKANSETAKTQEEQQQHDEAVKQAQENLDTANQNRETQEKAEQSTVESENKAVEQAEMNVDAANQNKDAQQEEAKSSAINQENAVNQAQSNINAAENTEQIQKNGAGSMSFIGGSSTSSGSFSSSGGFSGIQSGGSVSVTDDGKTTEVSENGIISSDGAQRRTSMVSRKPIRLPDGSFSTTVFESSGYGDGNSGYSITYGSNGTATAGGSSSSYSSTSSGRFFGMKALRELRDSLRRRRNLRKKRSSASPETASGLCEPSGNNLTTCFDDETGKTMHAPSYSIYGDEIFRPVDRMPWHRSFRRDQEKGYRRPYSRQPDSGKNSGTPGDVSAVKDDTNRPSYTGNSNLNDKPTSPKSPDSTSSHGSSSQIITAEQLIKAMQENNFSPPAENIEAIVKETNSYFTDPEFAAMFLGQLAHESGGFIYREEMGCEKGQCAFMYPTGGAPGKSYHGRGFIQLSYPENYKLAGEALGLPLWEKPEMVSEDPGLSAKVSTWYWETRVMTYPGVKDKLQFGLTTRAINGAVECNGQNIEKSKRRYTLYKSIAKHMGIKNLVGEGGCY